MAKRAVMLVVHTNRQEAAELAAELVKELSEEINFYSIGEVAGAQLLSFEEFLARREECELVLVLGGDGTILRGAELAHGSDLPVLGINLGHVGFLAQMGRPTLKTISDALRTRRYTNEKRMTLAYKVLRDEKVISQGWALNEVTIERNTEAMIELFVQVDHRPLSRWGCDGVICATPTGSTAYAFSAGGPLVWPDVRALVLLPLAAHALFSDPMVISPESEIAIDVESEIGILSADSLRKFPLLERDRIILTAEKSPLFLAHFDDVAFTDRLVAKFKLPVDGWRGE
jgi:NAD+ kinase